MPNSALQRTRRKRRAAELVRSAEKFMNDHRVRQTEVWAKLILSDEDTARIRRFFVSEFGVKARRVLRNMHITVYHSRRPIRGVESHSEPARVILPASETRFMVMSPGGENPRPELDPFELTVGIRVHKQSSALPSILEFRRRLLKLETQRVLGGGRQARTNQVRLAPAFISRMSLSSAQEARLIAISASSEDGSTRRSEI
jgi:hypothetical protein